MACNLRTWVNLSLRFLLSKTSTARCVSELAIWSQYVLFAFVMNFRSLVLTILALSLLSCQENGSSDSGHVNCPSLSIWLPIQPILKRERIYTPGHSTKTSTMESLVWMASFEWMQKPFLSIHRAMGSIIGLWRVITALTLPAKVFARKSKLSALGT